MREEYTVRDKLVSSIGKDSSNEWIVYVNTRVMRV